MKNITITLDESTAAWLRLQAAENGMSVARYVGEMLQERMHRSREYAESMRRFLGRRPFHFQYPGGVHPTRDELHDRTRLR